MGSYADILYKMGYSRAEANAIEASGQRPVTVSGGSSTSAPSSTGTMTTVGGGGSSGGGGNQQRSAQQQAQDWINNPASGMGGMNQYVSSQQQRYNQAIQSGDTDMIARLLADAQRVGYSLNAPQNAMGMGAIFPNLGATVAGAFGTMGQAAKGFFSLLMANPIILIITAIIGAVILLYKAWTGNWFGIRDKTKAAIEFLVNLFNSLKQKVGEIFGSITEFLSKTWEGIKNTAAEAWQGIKDLISGIWQALLKFFLDYHPVGIIIKHWDDIKTKTTELWNGIKRFLTETWERLVQSIVQKAGNLKNDVVNRLESIWSYIKGIPSKAYNWGRDIINGLWNGVKNVFGNFKNWFQDNVVGLLNRLNPFARHSPSLVEQVKAGVAEINRLYKGLDLSPVLSVTRPVQQPAVATAGGPVYLYGPLVRVEKMEVRSKEDVDAVSEALWGKAEQALRGEGFIRR